MSKAKDWRKVEMDRLEDERSVLLDLVLAARGIEPSAEAYTAVILEVSDRVAVSNARRALERAEQELAAHQAAVAV